MLKSLDGGPSRPRDDINGWCAVLASSYLHREFVSNGRVVIGNKIRKVDILTLPHAFHCCNRHRRNAVDGVIVLEAGNSKGRASSWRWRRGGCE